MENLVRRPDPAFWRGRNVLVTGHTGFKGGWLTLWLARMGAAVTGIALPPNTTPSLFERAGIAGHCAASHFHDIRDGAGLARLVREAAPEIVFHLAAQPLVRASYREPVATFAANVMGTAHLLDALRDLASARVAVMITTDKVYHNREWPYPYREDDALGGHDPYSASKAASEIVIASYRDSFLRAQGMAVASARAGNVIGGGDWAEDRLIPDAVRAWLAGDVLEIRRPAAIRPWQHVLEPLCGYLVLAEAMAGLPALAGAYNFGPPTHEASTVRDVVDLARSIWGGGEVRYGDGSRGPHEANWLALEVAKVRTALGLGPRWALRESVERTIRWYREEAGGADAAALCSAEIAAFEDGR
nr:CDP-glucose 4,6-dehydratase [Rhabdaerophilum calidifontis]